MNMTPEAIKRTSLKMCDLLPNDPQMAVTVAALNLAHVVVATGCDDESAMEAFRRALKQMRQGHWWMDA